MQWVERKKGNSNLILKIWISFALRWSLEGQQCGYKILKKLLAKRNHCFSLILVAIFIAFHELRQEMKIDLQFFHLLKRIFRYKCKSLQKETKNERKESSDLILISSRQMIIQKDKISFSTLLSEKVQGHRIISSTKGVEVTNTYLLTILQATFE